MFFALLDHDLLKFRVSSGEGYKSTGSYEFADNILTADLHLNQHGKVRAVYGTKKREMDTRLEGKLKKEGKIVGKSLAAGKKQFEVKIRLTRLGDID